jgi:hypothetical protein
VTAMPTAPPTMAVRPTSALRDQVIDRLSAGYAEGALELEELERRLALVHHTESAADLQRLVADLPAAPSTTALAPAAPGNALVPAAQARPSARMLSVFASNTRKGAWSVPQRLVVKAIFGNVELDFREAVMPAGPVVLEARAIFGNIEITVPPQLAVESSGSAVLGNFDQVDRAPANPDPGTPLLQVHGMSVFGNVEVKLGFMDRLRALLARRKR